MFKIQQALKFCRRSSAIVMDWIAHLNIEWASSRATAWRQHKQVTAWQAGTWAIRILRTPITDTRTKATRNIAAAWDERSKTGGSRFNINCDRLFSDTPKLANTACTHKAGQALPFNDSNMIGAIWCIFTPDLFQHMPRLWQRPTEW